MTSSEKVAYLKGLMEGMKLDEASDTGKLLKVIADILGDMAEDIEDVESDLYDLSEEVDAISDAHRQARCVGVDLAVRRGDPVAGAD